MPSEIVTADDETESCTVPLHGPLAVGCPATGGGVVGTTGAMGDAECGMDPRPEAAAELMDASKPALETLPSDVKTMSAVLDSMTTSSAVLPLSDRTMLVAARLLPRYSFKKS